MRKWLRIQEACEYCGIHRSTMYKWFHMGLPKSYPSNGKLVLVNVNDLDKFISDFMTEEKSLDDIFHDIVKQLKGS